MLNKKILAASIAVAFSSSAFAVVDIEADTGTPTFATEAYTATDLNTDGNLPVTNNANILDVTFNTGFTIGNGTSKYVVVTLNNAEFGAAPTLTVAGGTAAIAQGGTAGDSTVIFEVAATADIASAEVMTLAAATYAISPSAAATVSTALYETASNATNELSPLYTETGTLAKTGSGSTGTFTVENTTVATVASEFKAFATTGDDVGLSATLTDVGSIDVTKILGSSTFTPAGVALAATDIITANQDVTFKGDFSYGTWSFEDDAACAGGGAVTTAPTINTAKDAATVTVADLTAGPYFLCLTVNGTTEVVQKDTYTATLDTDSLTNDLGTLKYDTTSIEVPYITTFADYNQRLYLINYSSSDVAYSISFTSEDGVTAENGTKVTGSIPAKEMLMLKATDIVTLTGKTRTSAVIEVEAQDKDVAASMQTVNKSTGGTDTVVLN